MRHVCREPFVPYTDTGASTALTLFDRSSRWPARLKSIVIQVSGDTEIWGPAFNKRSLLTFGPHLT